MSDHPEELLTLYPDLLDEADRERVEAHLHGCEVCRSHVQRLALAVRATEGLPEVVPDPDLDRRARRRLVAEARAHGRQRRRWPLVVVPLAAAALVAAAVLLRPPAPTTPDEWTVKGEGEPSGEAALQIAWVDQGAARPLSRGGTVPAGATLLLGGTVTPGHAAIVFLVHDGVRERIWKGVGDATTAEGGSLVTGGVPVTATVPRPGAFEVEIWLGTHAADARLAGRYRLVALVPEAGR